MNEIQEEAEWEIWGGGIASLVFALHQALPHVQVESDEFFWVRSMTVMMKMLMAMKNNQVFSDG